MGNGLAQACVQPLDVDDHLAIVHPLDGLQGDDEVASILDVDDQGISIRHVAADGAELLASLDRIDLEPYLDVAVLLHAGPSWTNRLRSEFRMLKVGMTCMLPFLLEGFNSHAWR